MDVILLQDVEHVGLKGDVVDVKRGYGATADNRTNDSSSQFARNTF